MKLRTGLVLMALAVVGCGGSEDATSNFVGTWQPSTGAFVVTCAGVAPISQPVTDQTVFAAGTTAPLAMSQSNCTTLFDVSGSVATARSGQSCTTSDGTVHFTNWSFSTADGKTGSETFAGTVTVGTTTCPVNESATYARVSH
jgi:hypothetical protein